MMTAIVSCSGSNSTIAQKMLQTAATGIDPLNLIRGA